MNKKSPSTIADRINDLISSEGITRYEFCQLQNIPKSYRAFERALTKGEPNSVNPNFIKAVYDRYKQKVSMLYLMYGDDEKEITRYINKIKELEQEKLTVSEIFKKSYAEIKLIVDKAEQKTEGKKK